MYSSRRFKYLLVAVFSVLILVTVLGADWIARSQGTDLDSAGQGMVIKEDTEIFLVQRCSGCQQPMSPISEPYNDWMGLSQPQVEASLDAEFSGSQILAFEPEYVIVQLPAVLCQSCQWPEQGYIGLTDDNSLAVFDQEGEVFESFGPAPGTWLEELQQGIPFDNSEDGQLWLENLLS